MNALVLAALTSVALAVPADEPSSPVARYALVTGANNGGPDREVLRYAKSDAEAMLGVLQELGGVPTTQSILVTEPGRNEMLAALDELEALVAATATGRSEVVFYYSGHADDQGLLLHDSRVTWKELRRELDDIDADVRIAVLDSCSSGALLRSKGGTPVAPFLLDTSTQVSGHAYLTSASADEAAQEADRINGSFFTHHLVSGMRGAADATRDGRVTLNEAYHYAYTQTLASTENTQNGAQHANYDIDLSGAGDLVMTDLSVMNAGLVLSADLVGRLFVRDSSGRLVAEIVKADGHPMELGLSDGNYGLRLETPEGLFETDVTLSVGDRTAVSADSFVQIQRLVATARGGPAPEPQAPAIVPMVLSIAPGLASHPLTVNAAVALGLGGNRIGAQERASLSLGANLVGGDATGVMGALGANIVGGNLHGTQVAVGINVVDGDATALQAAVGVNLTTHAVEGGQVAVGANVAGGDFTGVQAAVGVNIVAGESRGVQLSVGPNFATDHRGVQLSTVNTAGRLRGVQLGLVNIATENDGLQVGLVNVGAGGKGDAIGLLTFQRGGRQRIDVWAADSTSVNGGFQLGGRRLYTAFAGAYSPGSERQLGWFGGGLGWHIQLNPVWFELETLAGPVVMDGNIQGSSLLVQSRLKVGIRVVEHINPYVALHINQLETMGNEVPELSGPLLPSLPADTRSATWPGVSAGVIF